MHRPSRVPQRTTHRPSGCEWLVSFASGRDGCPWPSSQRQFSPTYFLGHTAVSAWDTTSRACVCAYIATEACRLLRPALSRFVRTYSLTRVLPVWLAPALHLQPQRPPSGSWPLLYRGLGLSSGLALIGWTISVLTHTDSHALYSPTGVHALRLLSRAPPRCLSSEPAPH